MTTAANVRSPEGGHWYYPDGTPCYEIAKKDGSGMRSTTLADARKLNLLPSVTTILKILHKEGLVNWRIEQSCLAVLTTPRPAEEPLDAFVERVLKTERVQDQEMEAARNLGTDMHNGLEALFAGEQISDELRPWIEPAYQFLKGFREWKEILTETILVGSGCAGKADFIGTEDAVDWIVDFKTTKKVPDPKKGSWQEHQLQLSAYANMRWFDIEEARAVHTANLYISTTDCGKFVWIENPPWAPTFDLGFEPILKHWQWANNYRP